MGTYIYGLAGPSKLRQIRLPDGTTAPVGRCEFFCRANDALPYNAYDEEDRRRRQCLANVVERKRDAWSDVKHCVVYAVIVSGDVPEDGDIVLRLEGTVSAYDQDKFQHDPIWYDCEKYPGEKVGVLWVEGRRWELLPDEPPLVTLARQAL
jgi:hypothetical protein